MYDLSPTVRRFTFDPVGFKVDLEARAQTLWVDGYAVTETEQPGIFAVNSPRHERHLVDWVNMTCTCQYYQKQEIPALPLCKHLIGFEGLMSEQLGYYEVHAKEHQKARRKRQASERWCEYYGLLYWWNIAKDERTLQQEAEACQMDTATYRKWNEASEAMEPWCGC
jgi:hypothetical protein